MFEPTASATIIRVVSRDAIDDLVSRQCSPFTARSPRTKVMHLKVPSVLMLKSSYLGTTLVSSGTVEWFTSPNMPSEIRTPYSFLGTSGH